MTTIYWFICNNCTWQGESDELVSKTENTNDTDFSFCPQCGINDFEEDIEEVED